MADTQAKTKKCKFCQTEIDAKATVCPNCKKEQKGKFPLWLVILIIVILICGASATGAGKGGSSNNGTAQPTEAAKKFNIDEIYAKIQTGMTEAQVKTIVTKDPINCTESEIQGLGTMKLCTYGNVFLDAGSIMVTYSNGKVSSKTKSQY